MFNSSPDRSPLALAVIILLTILTASGILFFSPPFPYSTDSASYIDQARGLLRGAGAVTPSFGLSGPDEAPDRLFPIGFPIVLYLIGLLGVDPKLGALIAGGVSAVVLPLAMYFGFRRVLGEWPAVLVAALTVLSPSFLEHAPNGLTDVMALLLATLTIGLIINCRTMGGYFVAGLIGGFGYAVRNAHLALLGAIAVALCLCAVLMPGQRKHDLKLALAFGTGAVLVIGAVIARNLAIFGSLNPYTTAPSTIGVSENIRTYFANFAFDVTALERMQWSVYGHGLFLVGLIAAAVLAWRKFRYLTDDEKRMLVLCATYAVLGAAMVIAARSKYQWGVFINLRHTLQYTPFALAALVLLLTKRVPEHASTLNGRLLSVVLPALIMGGLLATHLHQLIQHHGQQQHDNLPIEAFESGREFLCGQPRETVLVSNCAYIFRISCSAPARHIGALFVKADSRWANLGSGTVHDSLSGAIESAAARFPDRDMRTGLFPGCFNLTAKDLPIDPTEVERLENGGWVIEQNTARGLLLGKSADR